MYNEESLNEAMELQRKLDASFGCTNILGPMEDIYKKETTPGKFSYMQFLTEFSTHFQTHPGINGTFISHT